MVKATMLIYGIMKENTNTDIKSLGEPDVIKIALSISQFMIVFVF
jgi:hypothetical protein